MRSRIAALIMFLFVMSSALSSRSGAQAPPTPSQELPAGSEVMNRGPVNEAFAEPTTTENQAGLVVPREPPANIEEVPPEDRPAGNDYVWVPGYWSWDTDRDDFIWVGACWRVAPPNMYWVPGYWAQVSDGWEWVAGFWAPEKQHEIEYLPAPPDPEQVEATGPPPDPDDIWVPGCWYWSGNDYVLRPGYWLAGQSGWVWAPSHYSWSPRGYVFVAGYWDLAFDARGVVFAPIYFPPSVYERGGFSYSPDVVIDLFAISSNLFTYPRYCHYYFGDYYDDRYVSLGIHPRFDCDRLHTWYDPIYEYDSWHNRRSDPEWSQHQRDDYDHHRRDRESRPPLTYREVQDRAGGMPEDRQRSREMVRPLQSVVSARSTPIRFERMNPGERERVASSGSDVRRFRTERGRWEAPANPTAGYTQPARPEGNVVQRSQPEPRRSYPRENQGWSVSNQRWRPAVGRHEAQVYRPERASAPPPAAVPQSGSEPRMYRPERVRIPQPPIVARGRVRSGQGSSSTPPPQAPKSEHGGQSRHSGQERRDRER